MRTAPFHNIKRILIIVSSYIFDIFTLDYSIKIYFSETIALLNILCIIYTIR